LSVQLVAGKPHFIGVLEGPLWVMRVDFGMSAACLAEFGNVLPEPGDEARWTEALPTADRAYIVYGEV
jgi:hypothetical protein